jgi:hypothetical protein
MTTPTQLKRQVRKMIARRFEGHPLLDYCYEEGSRSVRDFLEDITFYELTSNQGEADYWRSELGCLVPQFDEIF